jgi:hypothetical protein
MCQVAAAAAPRCAPAERLLMRRARYLPVTAPQSAAPRCAPAARPALAPPPLAPPRPSPARPRSWSPVRPPKTLARAGTVGLLPLGCCLRPPTSSAADERRRCAASASMPCALCLNCSASTSRLPNASSRSFRLASPGSGRASSFSGQGHTLQEAPQPAHNGRSARLQPSGEGAGNSRRTGAQLRLPPFQLLLPLLHRLLLRRERPLLPREALLAAAQLEVKLAQLRPAHTCSA